MGFQIMCSLWRLHCVALGGGGKAHTKTHDCSDCQTSSFSLNCMYVCKVSLWQTFCESAIEIQWNWIERMIALALSLYYCLWKLYRQKCLLLWPKHSVVFIDGDMRNDTVQFPITQILLYMIYTIISTHDHLSSKMYVWSLNIVVFTFLD